MFIRAEKAKNKAALAEAKAAENARLKAEKPRGKPGRKLKVAIAPPIIEPEPFIEPEPVIETVIEAPVDF